MQLTHHLISETFELGTAQGACECLHFLVILQQKVDDADFHH